MTWKILTFFLGAALLWQMYWSNEVEYKYIAMVVAVENELSKSEAQLSQCKWNLEYQIDGARPAPEGLEMDQEQFEQLEELRYSNSEVMWPEQER